MRLNGKKLDAVKLIRALNAQGAKFGIGRTDMIENRYVGIKSREIYEAPAATILMAAHRDLESIVLDRLLGQFKDELSLRYAKLIYEGYWFTDLKRALDVFMNQSQAKVSGTVRVGLSKGTVSVNGRKSRHSLYQEALAPYTEIDEFNHSLAKGFIDLTALPFKGQGKKR